MVRTRLYLGGTLALEDFPVSDVSRHLADPDAVVWLDLHRPAPGEIGMIGEEFGLHELAMEDAGSVASGRNSTTTAATSTSTPAPSLCPTTVHSSSPARSGCSSRGGH